jgi:EmrB/QacA subfamily drug resistance transporter
LPRRTPTPSVMTPELRRIATVVVLGAIMAILDTTIVAVALDTLGRDFRVPVSTIQWVTTGYLLALAVVIPVTGWAVDRFGSKRMFMISVFLFVIGSSLCGVAWSANSLIAFRVLQGIGGGMILPIGQSMLARAAGPQRMGRVMSVIGAPTVLGPILGPVLGGLIVSNFSWRWIFYINVPIGIVTLVLASRFLVGHEERVETSFDFRGFALLSPGLAALVYSLSEVGITGKFASGPVLVSFALGVVLVGGFIVHALQARHPLLDLRLFKNRNFAIANICMFILGATLYGSMFILPLYYQIARGQSPWQAGLLMAPQGIGAALLMRKSGSITDRVGPRRVVPAGILIMAAATVPFAFVTATSDQFLLAGTLFVRGMGLGLCMMPISAAAYFDLSHADVPRATTTLNIVRQIGASVATALFAVILQRQILENTHAHSNSDGALLSQTVKLPPAIAQEVARAFAHTFWWAVATILIAFVPTMFLPSHGAHQAQNAALDAPDSRADEPAMTVVE